MSDFLLELRCEEIPARMQVKASEDLARLFAEELAKSGLTPAAIDSFVTPRRLAVIARDLPDTNSQWEARIVERKGPRGDAPQVAIEGFMRSLAENEIVELKETSKGHVWFAKSVSTPKTASEILAEAVPAVIRAFPWPKSMRWGAASQTTESLRWVRPLQGIVAILGEELVDIEVEGIRSGFATLGHRFHHPGEITIGGAHDYAEKLRACHVIVSHQDRQAIIEAKSAEAAAAHGYSVIEDKGLVAENAGLTEWPVPLLGDFDPAFLEVPPEVIQLTLRINQKYFVLKDATGKLAPAFICTANIEAKDGGAAIIAGNRKVLAARLSDARFFWEQDRKTRLADHGKKLERITFHEKLGTVADKVERVAKLARWLVEEGIVKGADPDQTEQAARLAKADLVTEMVGEFPELQGVMGGYYARAERLTDAVADAIRDHYKPVGQGDEVPTAPVTVAVSLADKLDTIVKFFQHDMKPSGSKDPFALRRAALGVIAIVLENRLKLDLSDATTIASAEQLHVTGLFPAEEVIDFFADRLKVQQKEAGVRHDLIDAVFALGGEDDLVRLLARVHALQSFVATDDGTNLLAGYKRAANILRKDAPDLSSTRHPGLEPGSRFSDEAEGSGTPDQVRGDNNPVSLYTPEPAEAALIAALDAAEPLARQAVADERFADAMAALATLRSPIDAFFDSVTVNDADPEKRATRLALLARVRDAVHQVADFSKISG
ncbi:glycine--tRNA ligase subunit beta [Sphingobium amiense]|nr:glycine--tRNA ligase subunit beta [Sphingobium amiense]